MGAEPVTAPSVAQRAADARSASPDQLVQILQTRDLEWQSRDAALQRVAELARQDEIDAAAKYFKPLVLGVSTQLPDLRSQIVRSASFALTELASATGDHVAFDRPMRDAIVPSLLQLIGNGNKVLAAAGRECLPALFEHSHFDGSLKLVISTLRESKQAAVRHLCAECLHKVLQTWPLQVRCGGRTFSGSMCSEGADRLLLCFADVDSIVQRARNCDSVLCHGCGRRGTAQYEQRDPQL
eukprot:6190891-Pleurochrysis_carterae.AAC.1